MLEKKLASLNKEYYESIKNSSIKNFLKSNQNKTTINNELDSNSKTNATAAMLQSISPKSSSAERKILTSEFESRTECRKEKQN